MSDTIIGLLIVVCIVALGVLGIVGVVQHYRWVEKCERNGGHIEQYDCRHWTTTDCTYWHDNMCWSYTTHEHTSCKERCAGASAEERP